MFRESRHVYGMLWKQEAPSATAQLKEKCRFLKHTKERYGVRAVVVDRADWYAAPCRELDLRR